MADCVAIPDRIRYRIVDANRSLEPFCIPPVGLNRWYIPCSNTAFDRCKSFKVLTKLRSLYGPVPFFDSFNVFC